MGKGGVDCFDWTFFLFLPRLVFFLFLFVSVILVFDGIVPPSRRLKDSTTPAAFQAAGAVWRLLETVNFRSLS
jgi:hypothetical protein